MKTTMDQILSSLNVPFDPGMPEGAIPLSMIHFS